MFDFFLSDASRPVKEGGDAWLKPFPMDRNAGHDSRTPAFTYGDYFLAVRQFLEQDGYSALLWAASHRLKRDVDAQSLAGIGVFLVKHGAYYHPSRVEVRLSDQTVNVALNVALTDSGFRCMENECRSLSALNRTMPNTFIPDLFHHGIVSWRGRAIGMFIAEWFEGYAEFHLSPAAGNTVVVWDSASGHYALSRDQEKELYRQASRMLTFFYDPLTSARIHSWHHAAGDFVVRFEAGDLDVKLITVRDYASPFPCRPAGGERRVRNTLDALLVFFVNLSIRMRIDRADGTGDFIWSGNAAVEGTVKGFADGLALRARHTGDTSSWVKHVRDYVCLQPLSELRAIADAIVEAYHPEAPDTPLAARNIREHTALLHEVVQQNGTATQAVFNTI